MPACSVADLVVVDGYLTSSGEVVLILNLMVQSGPQRPPVLSDKMGGRGRGG